MSDIGASYPPPPPRPIEYQDMDSRGWWVSVLAGVALVLLGLWLVTNLYDSVIVLAILVGVSLIVGGFVEAAIADDAGLGWAGWLAGGLTVAAGVAVLVWPDITLWASPCWPGPSLLVAGVLHALWAISRRDHPDWKPHLVIGVLTALVGLGRADLAGRHAAGAGAVPRHPGHRHRRDLGGRRAPPAHARPRLISRHLGLRQRKRQSQAVYASGSGGLAHWRACRPPN